MEQYLKEQEAADYLSVSVGTLRNWRHKNKGPAYRKPETGLIRYALSDLDRFMITIVKNFPEPINHEPSGKTDNKQSRDLAGKQVINK